MIANDSEYRQALDALTLMRAEIAALHRDVYPRNPKMFAAMAAAPLDEMGRLEREVREFVGVTAAEEGQADVWLGVRGEKITWPHAATSILTEFLDSLRKGLQQIAEFNALGHLSSRPTAEINRACDLEVIGLQTGSLRVGVVLPYASEEVTEGLRIPRKHPHATRALDELFETADMVTRDRPAELESKFPAPEHRRVVLNALKGLSPRLRGVADAVELRRGLAEQSRVVTLGRETVRKLTEAIGRTTSEETVTVEGTLREIDLDQLSCIVRRPDSPEETRCRMPEEALAIARDALDRLVRVTGTRTRTGLRGGQTMLSIITLDILEPEE